MAGLKVRCERRAEVRICHDYPDAGLTLASDNQWRAGQGDQFHLKEIEIHWREVLRLATSIKQGTVTSQLPQAKRTCQSTEENWPY